MKEGDLPMPLPGAEWQVDQKFSAADELLRDPELETVFKAALEKGVGIVTRSASALLCSRCTMDESLPKEQAAPVPSP